MLGIFVVNLASPERLLFALPPKRLNDSLLVLTASMDKPWMIVETLQDQVNVLEAHLPTERPLSTIPIIVIITKVSKDEFTMFLDEVFVWIHSIILYSLFLLNQNIKDFLGWNNVIIIIITIIILRPYLL